MVRTMSLLRTVARWVLGVLLLVEGAEGPERGNIRIAQEQTLWVPHTCLNASTPLVFPA